MNITKEQLDNIIAEAYDNGYLKGWMDATFNFQENMIERDVIETNARFNQSVFIVDEYHRSKGE